MNSSGGGTLMGFSNSYGRSPFTVSQWQELEHQALIFKYMVAGLPVPPDLVLPIQKSFDSISHGFFHHPTLSYCSFYGKKVDPEPGRCRRTDGKKWRCSKEAYPDSKYCERHMHRGRNRSRKPVESQTMTHSSSTVTSLTVTGGSSGTVNFHNLPANAFGNLQGRKDAFLSMLIYRYSLSLELWAILLELNRYLQGLKSEGGEHCFFSEASGSNKVLQMESQLENTWPLMSTRVASFSTSKSSNDSLLHSDYPQHSFLSGEYASGEHVKEEGQPLRPFFNEWPKSRESWSGLEDERSNQTAFSTTQLSISIPMSSDFSATSSQSPHGENEIQFRDNMYQNIGIGMQMTNIISSWTIITCPSWWHTRLGCCVAWRTGNDNKGNKHTQDTSNLSEEELKKLVWKCLETKSYLVVIDDLWKTQDWDEVQDAFPDNRGSRILITSRLKEVALHTSLHPPYYLQFLSEEESWELFWRKVFRGEEYPSELEPLGKQIVQSCRGLPFSIVVLAGLLANKEKSYREWSKVVGHVNWYLTQNETQVKDIVLKLSYDNLPRRLKPCFLYLGIFPEDFEIPIRPLLQRWVAEGFIQETGNRDPDDVAEDYLYELIDRSLVQVARVKTSGGVKTCRIHDLLRDLCVLESKEDKIFEVCTDNNILIPTKPRRLSIHCNTGHYISSSNNDHSYYYFTHNEWNWLFKSFKLVRVLEFGMQHCRGKIPSNLGNFIHLRYLRISSHRPGYVTFRIIPTSILTLRNLQTIEVGHLRTILPISFPAGMWKLKHLRHLNAHVMLRGHYSGSDEVMWNLQTIKAIVFDRQTSSLIKKGSFPNLKKLGLDISSGCKDELSKLLQSLQQLSHLNELRLVLPKKSVSSPVPSNYDSIDEWHIGCKPQEQLQSLGQLSHLTTLKIDNALDLLMRAITFPPNITKLTLSGIRRMTDEGMNALGSHTKLRILKLIGEVVLVSSNRFDLTNCVAGGFPQLQVFQMKHFNVENWKLANGAMLCLQSLIIDDCPMLLDLPEELQSLTTLRKVQVRRPSNSMTFFIGMRELKIKDGCELIVNDH
ncbi:Growth-regulating factor 5 [Spatholobus suberectus]|nr:Growth-regulating factor 5 [Spatholobus suberectus]